MYKSGFRNCCAGFILSDFGHTNTTAGTTLKTSVEDIKKWLKSAAPANSGFYVIAINGPQHRVMKPILEGLGWKCVAENMKSPNHPQSKIFLWLKADYAKEKKAPSNSKQINEKKGISITSKRATSTRRKS